MMLTLAAENLDRLCRGQEDVLGLHKQSALASAKPVTLAESEFHELHIGIKDAMNAPVFSGHEPTRI